MAFFLVLLLFVFSSNRVVVMKRKKSECCYVTDWRGPTPSNNFQKVNIPSGADTSSRPAAVLTE